MKILILLLVVGIFSQNCTISIAPNSIEDIKKGYTRAAYMKISIKKPRANFLSFGLISRDFEFFNLDLNGKICNFTNGIRTITEEEKNSFFLKLLFNATIPNTYITCTQFVSPDKNRRFEKIERLFQTRDDRVALCCNFQGECKLYNEPILFQVSQWMLVILKLGFIGVLTSYVASKLLRYDSVKSCDTYVTNNFDPPDANIFNISKRLRIVPTKVRNFFVIVLMFSLIFVFSLLNTLLPSQWPETNAQNIWYNLNINPAFFSTFFISCFFISILGLAKLILKFMTKEHYQSYPEKVVAITIQFFHILISILILNILWIAFIPEKSLFEFTAPWITRILFCFIMTIYAFSQIKYFDFFFQGPQVSIPSWKYYINIHSTIIIETLFAYFLFTTIYYCSNVLTDYIWYNMVVVLLYPTSLSIYIGIITVFLVVYEFLSRFQKLYTKIKELIISNCPLKDLSEIMDSQKPSVLKIQSVGDSGERLPYYIPLKWKYFYVLCDIIDFRYAFVDAIKSAVIQLTIISVFFIGIIVFIPPSFEGLIQLGLTTLMPIIPRIASTVVGTTSSLEEVVIVNRFKMAIKKLSQDLFKLEKVDDRESYEPQIVCLREMKEIKVE